MKTKEENKWFPIKTKEKKIEILNEKQNRIERE